MKVPDHLKNSSGGHNGIAAQAIGLSKTYGDGPAQVTALDNVTVEFGSGRLTAIMGPSGSGQSTLMHCMAALDAPSAGRVIIDGVDITHLKDKALTRLRRDRLGFVFQAYNLIPTLTAQENITLPMDIAGAHVDPTWFDVVIDTLSIRDRLPHRPDELSGGQQRRVACARALLSRPAIVFADEPTGNLDSRASAEILSFLRASVDDFGQTIVMVTHDPSAASYADRVIFLVDGRIVDDIADPTMSVVLARIQELDRSRVGTRQGHGLSWEGQGRRAPQQDREWEHQPPDEDVDPREGRAMGRALAPTSSRTCAAFAVVRPGSRTRGVQQRIRKSDLTVPGRTGQRITSNLSVHGLAPGWHSGPAKAQRQRGLRRKTIMRRNRMLNTAIVVGINGGQASIAALEVALKEAALRRSQVLAITCWPMDGHRDDTAPVRSDSQELATELLEHVIAEATHHNTQHAPVVREVSQSFAGPTLVAASRHADLLVLGSTDRSSRGRHHRRQTIEHCLRYASAPVLVVPWTLVELDEVDIELDLQRAVVVPFTEYDPDS